MTFESGYELRFLLNREVRRVSRGWEHPRDERGRYVPLLPEQMPAVAGDGEIMAYETTTEGTPFSPAFPDTRAGRLALVNWCAKNCTTFANHKADAETWAAILFGENFPSVGRAGSVRFE